MREDYFLYGEEIEWCVRATALGLRLGFAPDAQVLHQGGSTTGSSGWSRLSVYLGERNKVLLTRDRFPGCMPSAVVASALILVVRCVQRRAWRQILYGLSGWMDGLRNRRGPPRWLTV
jgi:GT2 family glycosyltransferase